MYFWLYLKIYKIIIQFLTEIIKKIIFCQVSDIHNGLIMTLSALPTDCISALDMGNGIQNYTLRFKLKI